MTALTALALACEPQEPAGGTPEAGEAGEGGTEGMRGMGSGGMGSMDDGMMERMRGHMEAMGSLPADSLGDMLPTHRQMVANMLAQMNREVREMEMSADSAWDATVDSLRSDLDAYARCGS